MFGVSAFINYTIAVAVWTRFCFHVFLTSCAICGAFLSGICILGWTGRCGVRPRRWISLRHVLLGVFVLCLKAELRSAVAYFPYFLIGVSASSRM
jgi:hypothetical protein